MQYPLSSFAKKCAGGWIDRCPAHDDKNPSLSIKETSDGVLLLKCFAGCRFEQIIEAAGLKGDSINRPRPTLNAYTRADAAADLSKRVSMAKNIWQASIPLGGSLAQSYLNSRGIECWSDDIRFHPSLYYSKIEAEAPAMVSAIRRDRQFVGVHRTFLSPTGEKLNKMMLDLFCLAAIITKFALYLGVLTATGTVLATRLFGLDRTNGLAAVFAALGLLATIFAFLLRGANLTGDASGMVDPEMLSLLWATPVGTAFMVRILGLGLLIVGLFLGRIGIWLSMLGGVIAVGSFGQVGHIADRVALLLDITLMIHLLAIALWIGILTPLRRLASSASSFADAAAVGHQFGAMASVTVPGLIVAGVYMSYHLVGSFAALIETDYGRALIVKLLLVGLLLALAAANKFRFVPALRSGDPSAARHLSQSIAVEWVIISAVLGTTAVLTTNLALPV